MAKVVYRGATYDTKERRDELCLNQAAVLFLKQV